MAKAKVKLPKDWSVAIDNLGKNTDEICKKSLEVGGEIVLAEVRTQLNNQLNGSQSTGQLQSSLGLTPPKQRKNGDWDIKVGFAPDRTDGKRNGFVAAMVEFGNGRVPPRPFIRQARRKTFRAVKAAMLKIFEGESKK